MTLISKIISTIQPNYTDYDPKDTALLVWSFGRLKIKDRSLAMVLKSKVQRLVKQSIDND